MLTRLSAEEVRAALGRLRATLGLEVDLERLVGAEPMLLVADVDAVRLLAGMARCSE
jgi:hypothetical protein